MKYQSRPLWEAFRNAIISSIQETAITVFEEAWKSCYQRTEFYFNELLPQVAGKLNLQFKKERPFKIDGVFWTKAGQTTEVPVIYLESENIATRSNEEVYKLCCVNAPLKVLIICTEWDDATWRKELGEGYWHYIIEDFKDEVGLKGLLAFIIADWQETLRFHSYVINEGGEVAEDTLLAEKQTND